TWLKDGSRITVMEGAKHNLPDADTDAQGAAKCIKRYILLHWTFNTHVGGSALLPAPVTLISLQEKQNVTLRLTGGGLAHCAHPLSPQHFYFLHINFYIVTEAWPQEIWSVLDRYGLIAASLPTSVKQVPGHSAPRWEEAGEQSDRVAYVLNAVIGSNSIALECAGRRAGELGFRPVVLLWGLTAPTRVNGYQCEGCVHPAHPTNPHSRVW
uniref:MOFRL-associated domain-containing protein n=1 Tax=Oncorhynchus mykiss TaxID=8022 RepID=A0A8C7VIU0_ONCMY